MVKALRNATDESMPTPSVKSVDTEVGRLDHMRHGSSEVAALHGFAGRVHGSHVSVLANSSVSEQLATDFLNCCEMPLMRQHRRPASRFCRLSSVDWILSAKIAQKSTMRQRCNNLLIRRPVPTCACRRKLAVLTESSFFPTFFHWRCREHSVSGRWHSLGRDHGRYPKSADCVHWRCCILASL